MQSITSSSNHLIKEVKSLKQRKHREQKELFFIEGYRIVDEAVKYGGHIKSVLVSEEFIRLESVQNTILLDRIKQTGCSMFLLPGSLYREITDTDNPQGIMAVMGMNRRCLDEILAGSNLFIMLEAVQDPGNMGTIIRTADAAGFNGVLVSEGCVDTYNPKVLRSTMGSIFRVPVVSISNIHETTEFLNRQNIKVYAAHLGGRKNYFDINMKCNTALIVGNEANGITAQTASCVDALVKIPMRSEAESLNVSVAASILMYECVRQKIQGS